MLLFAIMLTNQIQGQLHRVSRNQGREPAYQVSDAQNLFKNQMVRRYDGSRTEALSPLLYIEQLQLGSSHQE